MDFYDLKKHTITTHTINDARTYYLVAQTPIEGELINWGTILVVNHKANEYQNPHPEFHVYDLGRKFVYLASTFDSAVKMHEKRWEKWEEELEAEHGNDRS